MRQRSVLHQPAEAAWSKQKNWQGGIATLLLAWLCCPGGNKADGGHGRGHGRKARGVCRTLEQFTLACSGLVT